MFVNRLKRKLDNDWRYFLQYYFWFVDIATVTWKVVRSYVLYRNLEKLSHKPHKRLRSRRRVTTDLQLSVQELIVSSSKKIAKFIQYLYLIAVFNITLYYLSGVSFYQFTSWSHYIYIIFVIYFIVLRVEEVYVFCLLST